MDERAWYDRLATTADSPAELFEHFSARSSDGLSYHVLDDTRHGLERGTVIVETTDDVIRGFPSIPRVLVLDPGVPEFFDADRIAVEEKLNGFNVRIADVDGPVAFTRGGYVCPYTTGRARDLLDLDGFFADHPELMVCAELIGPESPYTTHDYDGVDTHAFRVFDLRDAETNEPVPAAERRELCARYGFDQPELFGFYDPRAAPAAVRDAIADLDAREREGVVMKSADGRQLLKYTTEYQHHRELAYAFSLPFEYGRDFVFSRVIREAFQAAELDEGDQRVRERARDLGESILLPMVETIEAVETGDLVGERHVVRGDPERIDALLDHLEQFQLRLAVEADYREGGERVVEFLKVSSATIDQIEYYLDGGTIDE